MKLSEFLSLDLATTSFSQLIGYYENLSVDEQPLAYHRLEKHLTSRLLSSSPLPFTVYLRCLSEYLIHTHPGDWYRSWDKRPVVLTKTSSSSLVEDYALSIHRLALRCLQELLGQREFHPETLFVAIRGSSNRFIIDELVHYLLFRHPSFAVRCGFGKLIFLYNTANKSCTPVVSQRFKLRVVQLYQSKIHTYCSAHPFFFTLLPFARQRPQDFLYRLPDIHIVISSYFSDCALAKTTS